MLVDNVPDHEVALTCAGRACNQQAPERVDNIDP